MRGFAGEFPVSIIIPCKEITDYARECIKHCQALDYPDFEILISPVTENHVKDLTQCLYKVFFTPRYVVRRLTSIRGLNDLRFLWRGARAVVGHLEDFSEDKR